MAGNKMLRLKLLDAAFQTGRCFSLEELADWCVKEGGTRRYSVETIRDDISVLRQEYGAPIPKRCKDRLYFYTDPSWSLSKNPMTPRDLLLLHRIAQLLGQFPGLTFAERLKKLINALGKRYSMEWPKETPRIFFEHAPEIKGLRHLEDLYKHIEKEESIELFYQPFKYDRPKWLKLSPYFLQEYNFRWYLIARHHETDAIQMFALDRSKGARSGKDAFRPPPEDFEPDRYFKDVVGVSIPREAEVEEVELWIRKDLAPYFHTKPLHPSQERRMVEGELHISIRVIPNYELKSRILSWGDRIKVIKPQKLAEEIAEIHRRAAELYR